MKPDGSDLALGAGTPNLLAFRQPTDQFDVTLPSDDNFSGDPAGAGAPAGTYRAFSDGYWVGMAPLAIGSYELHFGGRSDSTGPFAPSTFTQDITLSAGVGATLQRRSAARHEMPTMGP